MSEKPLVPHLTREPLRSVCHPLPILPCSWGGRFQTRPRRSGVVGPMRSKPLAAEPGLGFPLPLVSHPVKGARGSGAWAWPHPSLAGPSGASHTSMGIPWLAVHPLAWPQIWPGGPDRCSAHWLGVSRSGCASHTGRVPHGRGLGLAGLILSPVQDEGWWGHPLLTRGLTQSCVG